MGPKDYGTPQDQWNFWALRHLAALCVLFAHAFALSGKLPMELLRVFPFLAGIAPFGVAMFFAISGFLISQSWHTRPRALRFMAHRALRIMPGLCGAIAFAVLLGWAYTRLGTQDYWTSNQLWTYVVDNLLLRNALVLPGVFMSNPVPQQVSGTFWTLPVEVTCYLWVLALGVCGVLARPRWALTALAAALSAVSVWGGAINPFGAIVDTGAMPAYFAAFLFGMAVYQGRRTLLPGWRVPLLAWAALALLPRLATPESAAAVVVLEVLRAGVFAWSVASVAAALGRVWTEPRGWPDLSYGIYLFGFPIQQALVASFPGWGGWAVFAASLFLTSGAAALSWYLIESPALRCKRYLAPGPGPSLDPSTGAHPRQHLTTSRN